MPPTLRPYQQDAAADIRRAASEGSRRVLFVGVTAFGKTNLFSSMCLRTLAKGRSAWVLVHRWTLHANTSATLTAWGCPHGLFDADNDHDGQAVQVVAKDTLAARLKKGWRPARLPDLLIMDEADLVESPTWQAAITAFPDAFVLGFTGTPQRLDGKGLSGTFDRLILGPSPRWMMDEGHIARPRYLPQALGDQVNIDGLTSNSELAAAVDDQKPAIVGDTVSHYLVHGQGFQALGAAINITAANRFAEAWNAAGIPTAVIHSNLSDGEQGRLFNALKEKKLRCLWSVDMMGRGVDIPSVKYLCCARPTHSLAWWLQLLGRVVRKDGEARPIVADHVGNLWRHGTVEMERDWSLDGKSRKERKMELITAITQCAKCFTVYEKRQCGCPECGHVPTVEERKLTARKGELREMEAAEIEALARAKRREQGQAQTLADLIKQGRARGMKNPHAWAGHVFKARQVADKKALAGKIK